MKKRKHKKLHKVFIVKGAYNTFIETGWVENPTFNNDIYLKISAKHKNGDGLWFLRTDEALLIIEGFIKVINRKIFK